VFAKDSRFCIVYCNDAFCKALGRPRDAILGRTDLALIPAAEAAAFRAVDAEVFATGQPYENEATLTDAAGKRRWVVTRKSLLVLPGGRYVVGVLSDVTERREAELGLADSERRLARAQTQL